MTLRYSAFFLLTVFALLVAGGTAQAQVYVLESTAANVRAGIEIAMSDRISIPAGATIRVVMPSGKTQTISGPFSGTAAELAKGQPANDGVIAWIKSLVQTGGSTEKTPGVTRSARAPGLPASFSWTAIPTTVDSTVCVPKGAKLELVRGASPAADRVTVVDLTTATRADAEFAAGKLTAAWPGTIALQDDRAYVLLAPDNRPRRQVTLRVIDRLPGEDDILIELADRGCRYQFDAWVKEKLAGGKKAS
jgi:hypothetical protein